MTESSGPRFLLRACVFLLVLIGSLLQLVFFTLLPQIELHTEFCNATLASRSLLAPTPTSAELLPPMKLLFQSLYVSPRELALQQKEEERRRNEQIQDPKQTIRGKLHTGPYAQLNGFRNPLWGDDKTVQLDALAETSVLQSPEYAQMEEEMEHQRQMKLTSGFFLQTRGQGHEAIISKAAYCINVVMPNDSPGVLLDFELYLNALPSARPVYSYKGNGEQEGENHSDDEIQSKRLDMPPSVIDIYLERHPVDKKYYPDFHAPKEKTIWMMQNVEFFDRHELDNPAVGVMMVKNRIGLKKVLEYRHRHQLLYSVFYTKHTSRDLYQPAVQRDWTSFLHLAGWSPFKNTKVILQAWALHPEWPQLIIRVIKASLCKWIEDHFGDKDSWRLQNVDYACGSVPAEEKDQLQNQIGLHLCPSETEGFGHYINEARSVGALILTSNVPPMNELVDDLNGVLVGRPHPWWWQTKGDLFMPLAQVDVADIEQGIEQILLLSIEERQRMGRRSRAKFLEDRVYFLNAMAALEESLCQDEIRIEKLQPYLY
ncbi:RxLR-like protein [Plasmopara halstedii]|uniref:RxLR-like protein n=1 Tax=Plasmopara halstedii TaxID=4781 RepID=A0A0P1AES7_PLAHL|nr:RxLR-like protein [Plasmopara halstedii]CEG39094.1 RxLR-like protein [Plasmopara halstedii]|eukprot:XP_024575463.1 RxLR-like protein [Plasmopara halstedii]